MKTKLICPWNLKVGQKLIALGYDGERRTSEIKEIKKIHGRFTGRSVWKVTTNDSLWPVCNFHQASKSGSLKLQKAEILAE